MRHSILLLALALSLCGCATMESTHSEPPPQRSETATEDRDTVAAVLMASTFQTMQHLAQAGPAEQAEILAAAREIYTRTPQGGAQLRYALMLATPGHPGRDPVQAQKLLRELAARPETLQPLERAVSQIELAELDSELSLKSDNERLRGDEQRVDRERMAATQRRLQTELDENARLHKQLEDAQAKLDAIAKIERNLTQRESGTDGGQQ
jgi:ATP-dependent Lon protease